MDILRFLEKYGLIEQQPAAPLNKYTITEIGVAALRSSESEDV